MPAGTATEGARDILLVRDTSLPEGALFSRYWPSGSARMLSFERDVGPLLFKQIIPMWRRESARPIAGLTDLRAFFCLSHAAGDYGLRLTYRSVQSRSDDWPSQAARGAKEAFDAIRGQALPISELLPSEGMLVSWLMVPRGRLLK